jgi:hypothetical protein
MQQTREGPWQLHVPLFHERPANRRTLFYSHTRTANHSFSFDHRRRPDISILEFRLDHATWDERRRELNVVYEASLNGERKRACEIMQFDVSGRQIRGEAFYGAAV